MSTKTFKIAKEADFSTKLSELNNKIDSVKKQITYLDVYNISDTVTDKNTFNAKVNALMNNSSLVINTTPFFVNNKLYKTGDIILKNNYGDIIHIKSQSGGIFYPSSVTKDDSNNYAIQYEFSESSPSEETCTVAVNTPATLAKQITFTNLTSIDNNSNYVYGVWQKVSSNIFNIDIFKKDSTSIQPYIKFFISSDTENGNLAEEILLDYKIEEVDGNKWKITIDSNQFIRDNQLWVKVK